MTYFRAAIVIALSTMSMSASAQNFNEYILKSIVEIHPKYELGGYNIREAFTHNIEYGGKGTVSATNRVRKDKPPYETMCVAAVSELIIYAMKRYATETGDKSVFEKLPLSTWSKGNVNTLKANIFMFAGTGSRGTGHTLQEFGIGEELRFQDLIPGDFINFNRKNKSGHAVIFLGYLDANGRKLDGFGPSVAGFRYFSAQGKGKPDAGLGYRNAFFDGTCSRGLDAPSDCGIIRSNSRVMLNVGRMYHPSKWNYSAAVDRRKQQTRSIIADQNPELDLRSIDGLVEAELSKELTFAPEMEAFFNGETSE